MNEPVIELHGVSMNFKSGSEVLRILSSVDLSILRGETVAVEGASGSGKSTLLHIMSLLLKPSSGGVRVMGRDSEGLDDNDLADLRRSHFGFVFQAFHLIPTLTAKENVNLVRAFYPHHEGLPSAEELLASVGLESRADHLPRHLSGGEQQRVAIARALANRPSIVFADEPTGHLDRDRGIEIVRLLLKLAEEGVSIIVATHDMEVSSCAMRRMAIVDGSLVQLDGYKFRDDMGHIPLSCSPAGSSGNPRKP